MGSRHRRQTWHPWLALPGWPVRFSVAAPQLEAVLDCNVASNLRRLPFYQKRATVLFRHANALPHLVCTCAGRHRVWRSRRVRGPSPAGRLPAPRPLPRLVGMHASRCPSSDPPAFLVLDEPTSCCWVHPLCSWAQQTLCTAQLPHRAPVLCRIESALESVDSTGQLPDGARSPGQLILPATANQTEQQFAAPVPALPLP